MRASKAVLLSAATLLLAAAPLSADVRLPAVIGEGMVLQSGMAVPVWGWAEPGEKVTVKLAGQTVTATTDDKGDWAVKLAALKAGGPHTLTVSGKNTLTLNDVLVGEVWLCSGQSNMAMTVGGAKDAQQEAAAANFPAIRHFRVARAGGAEPQKDCKGQWTACSPKTVRGFSATAFFFGRALHRHLNVPIGLINSSVGGTPIEFWTDRKVLLGDPAFKPITAPLLARLKDYDPEQAKQAYAARLAKWKQAAAKAKAAKKRPPRRPRFVDPTRTGLGSLYNGMIAPLCPFAIRGVIWYQGERNCRGGTAYLYRKLLPALIANWRAKWGQGDFPFLFVQLPNWRGHNPGVQDWAVIRESFLQTLQTPATGMAVTIDVGDSRNIHPKNKQAVGARLALAARAVAYGETLCHSGPLYDSLKIEGNQARIRFKHTGDGLVAKGGPLKGFAIAGADKQFVAAEAKIDGHEVVAGSDKVAAPVAVRYAWANDPQCNLYNSAGLPASPFRTDTWPVPGQLGPDAKK